MDQLKTILAVTKKYHFWALCALLIVVGLSIWMIASTSLSRQFAQRRDKLNADLSRARQISSQPDPPNERIIDATRKQHDKLKGDVLGAWTFLYNQQKKNNPWPAKLGQEFLDAINSLGPNEEIPRHTREIYQFFIKGHLPELFTIVGARVEKNVLDASRGGGTSTKAPSAGTSDFGDKKILTFGNKVDWTSGDWGRIVNSFDFPTTPTSLQVRLAQENLWVYEALLRIIDRTNAGATSRDNAAVNRIERLEIGKDAAGALQRGQAKAAAAAMAMGGGGGSPFASGGPSGGSDAAAMIDEQLKQGRYVDQNGVPLAAGMPEPFKEFRMMPIRMLLSMDQRKIPDLLAQCANSSMPVLIQEVHIGSSAGASKGGARSGGTTRTAGGAASAHGSAGFAVIPGGGEEAGVYDMSVEVVGVIYIYNPPNYDELGKGAAGDNAKAPAETPAAKKPAGTPERPR